MIKTEKINWLARLAIAAATIFAAWRFYVLVDRHAVNVLFLDQFDYLTPLFGNPTAWEMFNQQHGPPRLGIGLFLDAAIGAATGWNTRSESFFAFFLLIAVTFAAIALKKRLFGDLTMWDALIPLVTLSFTQIEPVVLTAFPAHGILPLLLVLLCGLCLTVKNSGGRYLGFAGLNFLTTFTGFGFFIGLVAPFVFGFFAFAHRREKENRAALFAVTGLVLSILTLGLFFTNYVFQPAVDCFVLPHSRPHEYCVFIGLTLTAFVGFPFGHKIGFAKWFGLFLLLAFVAILLWQIYYFVRYRKYDAPRLIIFVFISFTLLFAANAAVGRICLGLIAGQASRYMPLIVPAWLAAYFFVLMIKPRVLHFSALASLIILLVLLPIRRYESYNYHMEHYTNIKRRWAACYKEKENIAECDKAAGHVLYPRPEATHLTEKLQLLKEKGLNFYAEP